MRAWITLFNAAYAIRGIAMLDSLLARRPAGDAAEIVVALVDDDASEHALRKWFFGRAGVEVHRLDRLAEVYPALVAARRERSVAEFYWTCASCSIDWAFATFNADEAVYVDADLWFTGDPRPAIDAWSHGTTATMLTPHAFSPDRDHSDSTGRFCVQLMPFRRGGLSKAVLDDWITACLAECSYRPDLGLCGDQHYLDAWPNRWPGQIAITDDPGMVGGPWNIGRMKLRKASKGTHLEVCWRHDDAHSWSMLVFYHFQNLKFHDSGAIESGRFNSWAPPLSAVRLLYLPYLHYLHDIHRRLGSIAPGPCPSRSLDLRTWLGWLRAHASA